MSPLLHLSPAPRVPRGGPQNEGAPLDDERNLADLGVG